MRNYLINLKKEIFPIGLMLILAASRLMPHPDNFTPIIAMAIMSSYFFRNIYLSGSIVLFSMFLSDIFIGFYNHMLFVYLPIIFILFAFYKFNKKINIKNLFIYGFAGSAIFFVISNFGVWLLADLYEKNIHGLIECYFMAIPFFQYTLVSTLIFSYATMIVYSSVNKYIIVRY